MMLARGSKYPNEVSYVYKPSCVAVQCCGGCCGDEGQCCVPMETKMVTMEAYIDQLKSGRTVNPDRAVGGELSQGKSPAMQQDSAKGMLPLGILVRLWTLHSPPSSGAIWSL
nr:PREDICTED: snake venom vascular endothelial growth factor toxin 1-like [Struthio camelus australis]